MKRSVPFMACVFLSCVGFFFTGLSSAADLIEPVGKVEKVASGFQFTEGPAWSGETLYFTDIPATTINQLQSDETIVAFTTDSKHSNGIVFAGGRMLACQMDGQVVQYDPASGKATVLADRFEGKRFNAPNDLTVDAEGGIYFTDPLFRAPMPLPQGGQYCYYIPNVPKGETAEVIRVTEDLAAPNGIGLSPDGKSLYVCPSRQSKMLVYEVLGPGKLSEPKTFCTLKQPAGQTDTGADGITLDVKGNVYITSDLGVQIFTPEGQFAGVVAFPEKPANVCFGGGDWKTMYVTARTSLYRVAMPIAGLH